MNLTAGLASPLMALMESELKMPVSNSPVRKLASRVGLFGYVVPDHLGEFGSVAPMAFNRPHFAEVVALVLHAFPGAGANVLLLGSLGADGIEVLLAIH